MFLFNVLLGAVISGGFIMWALAGCHWCPYLKSYFQFTLSVWLMLWLINNTRDLSRWVSKRVSKCQKGLCQKGLLVFCVCHLFSNFQKPLMDPQEMWLLFPQWRTNPDIITARHKSMMFRHTIVFCVNGSSQLLYRVCVVMDSLLRESMLTCVTPGSNHQDPRWRETNSLNCSSIWALWSSKAL